MFYLFLKEEILKIQSNNIYFEVFYYKNFKVF